MAGALQKIPTVSLLDQDGISHSLAEFKETYLLLYFYPKDDTPGCTTEACTFRDLSEPFKSAGIQIIGVSADSVKSHKKFAEKYHLTFPLLADTEKQLIHAFGVWKEKSLFGKKYMGIERSSFLIDKNGRVLREFRKVNPFKHPQEVLSAVA